MNAADLNKTIAQMRLVVLAYYGLQAAMCLVGAIITGGAMYAILHNAPIMGGLMLLLAFTTCREFADCAAKRGEARASLRLLLQYRRELQS